MDVARRRRGMDPAGEAQLGGIHVADAREVALVQEGSHQLTVGLGLQPSQRLGLVPVGPEQIGSEVADDFVLEERLDQLHDSETEAHRSGLTGLEQYAHLAHGTPPPLAHAVDLPDTLHLEVRVDREAGVGASEEVLAARQGRGHRRATQVGGRMLGYPEVTACQHPSGQGSIQETCRPEDGVALRHASSVPWAWKRSRSRSAPGEAGCHRRRGAPRRRPSRP